VQYRKVLWNMARFDFGDSLKYEGQSVKSILFSRVARLRGAGFVGLSARAPGRDHYGNAAALRQNTWIDYASMTLAMLGISFRILCWDLF